MRLFKKTIVAVHKLRVQSGNLRRCLRSDLLQHVIDPLAERCRPSGLTGFVKSRLGRSNAPAGKTRSPSLRPSIFVSYATSEELKGSHRYCGGEKLLNNLVLLLRRHGYDAYMVSLDGTHANWLVEHAPFLSLQEFIRRAAEAQSVRYVTSWILAEAFLDRCPKFYFWDQELATTTRSHFPMLARMMRKRRILATAGLNRSIQAWHMAVFERRASLLRTLVDERHWQPDEQRRLPHRIGYMDEGPLTGVFIESIKRITVGKRSRSRVFAARGSRSRNHSRDANMLGFSCPKRGKEPALGRGGSDDPSRGVGLRDRADLF